MSERPTVGTDARERSAVTAARACTCELVPRGPFSLQAAAEFGFGPNQRLAPFDGAMRLAFAVDGNNGYAGAVLRQDDVDGPVRVELELRGAQLAERWRPFRTWCTVLIRLGGDRQLGAATRRRA